MANKRVVQSGVEGKPPAWINQFSREYDFLRGLADLESALDELVEGNGYCNLKKRSVVPSVSIRNAVDSHADGEADSDSLKCCCSTDYSYLRLHEVRLHVTSCKSKLESLLSPAMHNGVNTTTATVSRLEPAGECKRCECARSLASAPASPRADRKTTAGKKSGTGTGTGTCTGDQGKRQANSNSNSHRFSLSCCSIPLRRKSQRQTQKNNINATSPPNNNNAPHDQPSAKPTPTPALLALPCLVNYDNVICNFLKASSDDLPEKMVRGLKSIKFDNFMWTDHQLILMVKWMFRDLQLLEHFDISLDVFDSWLCAVYRHYNPVPYHNFNHAFMVVQMVYALICQLRLARHCSKLELFTLLTSALVHDIDHPGLNNAYHVNARTSLALLYNDLSPLENHHCSTTFQILTLPQCNILSKFSNDDYKLIRSTLVACVLATDMAKHFDICRNIEHDLFDGENKQCILDWNKKEHRLSMHVLLIKWADISNEVRPLEVATKWTDCLLSEFFRQGDLEKELGLPVSPLMDRQNVTRITAQVNFIQHMLNPLAELMVHIFPQLDNDFTGSLKSKVTYYKSLLDYEEITDQAKANAKLEAATEAEAEVEFETEVQVEEKADTQA